MRAEDIRKLLKAQPFEPIRLGLSDGRSVLIKHPDQAVVANRHVLVGLAELERSLPLATPASGDTIAKDWLLVNILQISTIEPAARNSKPAAGRRRR